MAGVIKVLTMYLTSTRYTNHNYVGKIITTQAGYSFPFLIGKVVVVFQNPLK